MKLSTKLLATCVLLLAIGTAAQATTIYQASGNGGADYVSRGQWVASGFTTNTDSWTLNSVTLGMNGATDTSGNFFVSLYSNDANKPKSALKLLSGSANPNTAGSYEYTPTSPFTLSASTTYWIVAGVSSGSGEYFWGFGSQNGSPTTGSYVGYAYSYNQGTSFGNPGAGYPAVMTIDATKGGSAVPEASTLIGFGSALAMAGPGMIGWLKRRRS